MSQKAAFLALVISIFFCLPAFADDWVVVRSRGAVYAQADSGWQKLKRGAVISDDRILRTGANGNVELTRGRETITLASNTQVRIIDRASVEPYTIVNQDFGVVEVEAERRNVAHFEVRTPVLAAVVKGTKFVVASGRQTASVNVKRGHVFVQDSTTKSNVVIAAGQQASAAPGHVLDVGGRGNLPVVLDSKGKPADRSAPASSAATDAAQRALAIAIESGDKKAVQAAAKVLKEAEKAEEKASKEAEKAAEEAEKDAEKAAKDAEKADKKNEGSSQQSSGSSGSTGSSSSTGSGSDSSGNDDGKDKKDKKDKD